jgi:hypothetical protein
VESAEQRRRGRPFTATTEDVAKFPPEVRPFVLALRRAVRDRYGTLADFHSAYVDSPGSYALSLKEVSRHLRDGTRFPNGPSTNLVERIIDLCAPEHREEFLALRPQVVQRHSRVAQEQIPTERVKEQPDLKPGKTVKPREWLTVAAILAALAGTVIWLMVSSFFPDTGSPALELGCPIQPGPLSLVWANRLNSPKPAPTRTIEVIAETALSHGAGASVITVDGDPRVALTLPGGASSPQIENFLREAGEVQAKHKGADLLTALDKAARAHKPTEGGTIVVVDSGLATTGAVRFDEATTINVDGKELAKLVGEPGAASRPQRDDHRVYRPWRDRRTTGEAEPGAARTHIRYLESHREQGERRLR